MDTSEKLQYQSYMNTWYRGILSYLRWDPSAAGACVPVEEKVVVPFDVNPAQPKIRQVFDLQNAQNKDSLYSLESVMILPCGMLLQELLLHFRTRLL